MKFRRKKQVTLPRPEASPFGSNDDDHRLRRNEGGVVGTAASRTQAQGFARSGCWEPQPGAGAKRLRGRGCYKLQNKLVRLTLRPCFAYGGVSFAEWGHGHGGTDRGDRGPPAERKRKNSSCKKQRSAAFCGIAALHGRGAAPGCAPPCGRGTLHGAFAGCGLFRPVGGQ